MPTLTAKISALPWWDNGAGGQYLAGAGAQPLAGGSANWQSLGEFDKEGPPALGNRRTFKVTRKQETVTLNLFQSKFA